MADHQHPSRKQREEDRALEARSLILLKLETGKADVVELGEAAQEALIPNNIERGMFLAEILHRMVSDGEIVREGDWDFHISDRMKGTIEELRSSGLPVVP